MAQAAPKRAPQERVAEIMRDFDHQLQQTQSIKKEIIELNGKIVQIFRHSSEPFADEQLKFFVERIGQLRKALKDADLQVQLLSRAISFGK